jgi:small conductance mechanosensitive channel
MTMLENLGQIIAPSLFGVLLPLALTLVATLVGLRLVSVAARALERRIDAIYVDDYDRRARLKTLQRVGVTTARAVILAIAILVAFATIGVDIGPILTAAGIFGLALSLGAQTLIRDFLGGLTILLEDQYRVGDVITVEDMTGTVEKITLRRTNIRDITGRLHVVSNGDVRAVGNDTRDWARALIEFNLAFDTDVDKAVVALNNAMTHAAQDLGIKDDLLEAPEILGWNQFSEWAVTVRLWAKVKPGTQWQVSRVLRRYAMDALRSAGVTIASRNRLQWQSFGAD